MCGEVGGNGANGATQSACEITASVCVPCCPCTNRCELSKCPCIGKNVCSANCVPLKNNTCENGDLGVYPHGRRAVRTTSATAAAQGANAVTAAGATAARQTPKSPNKAASRDRNAATAAASDRFISDKLPLCVDAVSQFCNNMQHQAAANAVTFDSGSKEFRNIEHLVREYKQLHSSVREIQNKFKEANKNAAKDRAALVSSSKQHESLVKKYNAITEKMKVYQANVGQKASQDSPSKKRSRTNEPERQQHSDVDAAVDKPHASDDNQRASKLQKSNITSSPSGKKPDRSGMVHPDRLQQVQGALVGCASPVQRERYTIPASNGNIMYSRGTCLVATGVGARAHASTPEVQQIITELLWKFNLCREGDDGTTMPTEVHKIAGSISPIQWKIVFQSAEAATAVLTRCVQQPECTLKLRAFVEAYSAKSVNRAGELQHPLRQASDVTQVPTRAPSCDSVVCLGPPQSTEKQDDRFSESAPLAPRRSGAPIQFTTRRANAAQQPALPLQAPSALAEAQIPNPQHRVPQQGAVFTHANEYSSYPPHSRPMAHISYHGGGHPYGYYMQHPMPPYGPPMGYAPAGYVPAGPGAYHGFPPQF